jgi:DNA-binding beta-propeller fold protein YncE
MRAHSTIVIAAVALTSACGDKSTPKPAAAEPPASASPSTPPDLVEGFKQPESVKYDTGLDVWYVSNINGDPSDKDGNGFISRLKSDGSVDSLEFIAGGKNGVTLNGPKGMAIVGDTLWVADIDAVRGFDRRTGAPLASVDLKGRARFLNDVVAGPDALYITDSGFGSDGKGGMGHPGPDQVFRIAGGKATLALKNSELAAPNGIAWDSAGGRFIIGPFGGTTMQAWAPGQTKLTALGETPGQTDGIEVIGPGRILFTSWADSTLDLLQNGKVTRIATGLASPADIGVDLKHGRVAIPQLMENRVTFRQLPTSTP